jgi:dolichol-phosphate mannosyltransferase
VPALVAKWKEGYEVVAGRRVRRAGEPLFKRLTAFLYYRVMRALVGWDLPVDTGEFRLIDRRVVEVLKQCPQRQRLIRTLASWPGFRQTTVDYEHGRRYAGKSKYTFRKSLRLAITSITNFSVVPLRLAFYLGALVTAGSLVAFLFLLYRLVAGFAPGAMAFAVTGLWLLGGLQCLLLGILGEYVGRTHIEIQGRPIYVVRDRLGWNR